MEYPLLVAVRNADIGEVERLLKQGEDPNDLDQVEGTPLILATRLCPANPGPAETYVDIIRLLLGSGIDVHVYPIAKGSALHEAAAKGNTTLVELFLHFGAEINSQEDWERRTPLHRAVSSGSIETVAFLLSQNALVNVVADFAPSEFSSALFDAVGMTPLHLAAKARQLAIAELLLQAGASKDDRVWCYHRSFLAIYSNMTPHEVAIESRLWEARCFPGVLLKGRPDVNPIPQEILEEWRELIALLRPSEKSFIKSAPNPAVVRYRSLMLGL